MMHKAWKNKEDVPYCISRSSVKFQGHTRQKKSLILTQVWHFWTVTPVWIHQCLRNDAHSSKYHRRGTLSFLRSSVKYQDHAGHKIIDFDPNWAFPTCNSSLITPMAMKWCPKLEVAQKRYLIVFQCHPLNFKVTRDKNRRFWPELSVSGL